MFFQLLFYFLGSPFQSNEDIKTYSRFFWENKRWLDFRGQSIRNIEEEMYIPFLFLKVRLKMMDNLSILGYFDVVIPWEWVGECLRVIGCWWENRELAYLVVGHLWPLSLVPKFFFLGGQECWKCWVPLESSIPYRWQAKGGGGGGWSQSPTNMPFKWNDKNCIKPIHIYLPTRPYL